MNTDKIKWMSALPYLLLLLMVVNGNILGNHEIDFFGVQLSLMTLVPYLIYYFVNKNNENDFIASHTKKSMSVFIRYFFITVMLNIILNIMGLGILLANSFMFFGAGAVGLILSLPLFIVIIYTLISAVKGSIRAFKLIQPDGNEWSSEETEVLSASNT